MAKTIGSFDLASLKNLRDDVTQYFWFESDSSSAWGSGAHVTLYPESQFTNPSHANYMKGQNIIMNTDGFSIRNGGLPIMTLDNDSLDFNAVDTSLGTYITMATFGLTGATIGQTSGAHSVIDANGQRFYATNGTTQLANIGYGEGVDATGGTSIAPYYTFGIRTSGTIGNYSFVGGRDGVSSGYVSHAEGRATIASGNYSHAEGYGARASGESSHAEGESCEATAKYARVGGSHSHATGLCSNAQGYYCYVSAPYAHAYNLGTSAQRRSQTVIGEYNELDIDVGDITTYGNYVFIIGNGTADDARSNALTVDWDGNITINGHSSPIGKTETHIPNAISCASGKYYQVAYLTLDPGTWIISGSARFQQSNTTGIRKILFTNDTSNYNNVTTQPSSLGMIWAQTFNGSAFPTSGGADVKTTSAPIEVTTEKPTIRLIAYQSSGSAMNVTGRFYAIRIK